MFEKLDPNSEAYDSFQKFCIAAAVESCSPRNIEFHCNLLEHPIHPEKTLMLVYDKFVHECLYLIEVKEGHTISFDHPEDEAFYSWDVRKPIFPATAVIAGDQVTLGYIPRPEHPEYLESRITSREKYELLKGLFDEISPYPWKEFEA